MCIQIELGRILGIIWFLFLSLAFQYYKIHLHNLRKKGVIVMKAMGEGAEL
jgi:hypothetical protein